MKANIEFLVLTICFILNSCILTNSETDIPSDTNQTASLKISRIQIPEREHGYSNLKNLVFQSEDKLSEYLELIKLQDNWNNKSEFLNNLETEPVNFDSNNLFIYFHTEGSGSIEVSVSEISWQDEAGQVLISRVTPPMGTDDMAFYGYAFKVSKELQKVVFTINQTQIEILENDTNFNLPQEANILRVQIQENENGYVNLENLVINSSNEFNEYLALIESQENWEARNKSLYISSLQNANIDFDSLNLILFFIIENSGLVEVAVESHSGEGANALINMIRETSSSGTVGPVYYGFAFKVIKSVEKVIVKLDEELIEFTTTLLL